MLLENAFTVAGDEAAVWAHLLDVERVAPCLPGAELTEVVDDRTWRGRVLVRFGPVTVNFAGTVAMTERDDAARRVTLAARGTEQRGKGTATATITAWLEPGPAEGKTTVRLRSDVNLTGAVAQFSRGVLPDVARSLTERFADCLHAGMRLETTAAPPEATTPEPKPVGAISLAVSAVWARLTRFLRRLLRRP